MKNLRIIFCVVAVFALTGFAYGQTCEEIYGNDGYGSTLIDASLVTIPATGEVLRVEPSKNGGVTVVGNSGNGSYEVTICKTAWPRTGYPANRIGDPAAVSVEAISSSLAARGELHGWNVSFIIRAPQGARMKIETHNGPITLRDIDGDFEIAAQNGPLSLDNVSGEVVARLQNGPIRFDDLTGRFDLETKNGPLSVDLSDGQWTGARVRATTQNGPVKLRLTRAIPAGIQVSSSGWGKIQCPEELCGTIQRDERTGRQHPRSFSFGPATNDLVMQTGNGPLTISLD